MTVLVGIPAVPVAAAPRTYAINCRREQYKPVTNSGPKRCPGRVHRAFGRASFTYPDGAPPFRFRQTTFPCP